MTDILARLRNLVGVGRLTSADDSGELQLLQVGEGAEGTVAEKVTDDVVKAAHFGFASNPPLKSELVLLRVFGDRSLSIAIGSHHRLSRLKDLQPGEAALYDERGAFVWLTRDGIIVDAKDKPVTIRAATTVTIVAADKVRLEAPLVELTGDATIAGDLTVTGDIVGSADVESRGGDVTLNDLRDAYHGHTHGGVDSGSDSTAAPTPDY